MEFHVLGPLEVVREGRTLQLGAGKQRMLLAALLLHANEVVSTDRLTTCLGRAATQPLARRSRAASHDSGCSRVSATDLMGPAAAEGIRRPARLLACSDRGRRSTQTVHPLAKARVAPPRRGARGIELSGRRRQARPAARQLALTVRQEEIAWLTSST
jgi:hypothetical protein